MGIIIFEKRYRSKNHKINNEEKHMLENYKELINNLKNNKIKYTIPESEQLADEILKIKGYDGLKQIPPIIKIAQDFDFKVYKINDLGEDIAGNILIGDKVKEKFDSKQIIVVGEKEEYFHQRFVMAHELAHYFLDYLPFYKNFEQKKEIFMREYRNNQPHSTEEQRADRFAAELLMPKVAFLKMYAKCLEAYLEDNDQIIDSLSQYFMIKKTSIHKRIQEVME